MVPLLRLPSIGRCSAQSRSFLLGPNGPAGAPPGQRLRAGGYMAAKKKRGQPRSAQSECARFQRNPGTVWLSSWFWTAELVTVLDPTASIVRVRLFCCFYQEEQSQYRQATDQRPRPHCLGHRKCAGGVLLTHLA